MGKVGYLQGGSKKKIFPTTKDLLADIPHVSKDFFRTHGSPPIDHLARSRPSWFGGFRSVPKTRIGWLPIRHHCSPELLCSVEYNLEA